MGYGRGIACTSDAVVLTLLIVPARGKCFAGVAQLVEHLICNQRVRGSNPFASSKGNGLQRGKVASCNISHSSSEQLIKRNTHSTLYFRKVFALLRWCA